MATTVNFYNHTRELLAKGEIDFSTLRLVLRDDSTVFDATDEIEQDLLGSEVNGNGWPNGGEQLSNVSLVRDDTNEAMLTADDIEVMAESGPIGPAYSAILIGTSTEGFEEDKLLVFIDFELPLTAAVDTDFRMLWSDDGVIRWSEQ